MRLCVAVVPLVYSQTVPATCALKIDSMYAWQWCQSFCAALSRNHQDWRSPDACGECSDARKKLFAVGNTDMLRNNDIGIIGPTSPAVLAHFVLWELRLNRCFAGSRHRTSLLESLFLSPHQSCLHNTDKKITMNIPWTHGAMSCFISKKPAQVCCICFSN